jgi:hypothetical protein
MINRFSQIPVIRRATTALVAASFLALTGCAWNPFKKAPTPANADAPAAQSVASPEPTPDLDRAAALRALPPGTFVLDEKPPGFFTRVWRSVFKPKPKVPVAAPPRWIGVIRVVNTTDKYVLIDSQQTLSMKPGEVLNSVGNDYETGTVRVSPDKNPPFFIADIASGSPAVGDRVYSPQ